MPRERADTNCSSPKFSVMHSVYDSHSKCLYCSSSDTSHPWVMCAPALFGFELGTRPVLAKALKDYVSVGSDLVTFPNGKQCLHMMGCRFQHSVEMGRAFP